MGEIETKYYCSKLIPYTNKAIEFQKFHNKEEYRSDSESGANSYCLTFTRRKKIDHAGFRFEFETPESNYLFSFYDLRHWNSDEERWYKKGEQIKQYLESVSDDNHRTKYLDKWIDRFNVRQEMKNEFAHTSLYTVLDDLREQNVKNPQLKVFEQLFPKIKNQKT